MAVRRSILEYAEHLRWNTALQNLTAAEAAVLATLTERVKVPPGGYLIHQGSDDDGLFVIESGEAQVRVRGGTPLVLGVRGPGDVVGEISLMTQAPRTADVVALTPMVVFKLSATVYRRYVGQIDEVQAELARTASARMSETLLKLWVNA
jgi:CRP-like cAMP-binding protein